MTMMMRDIGAEKKAENRPIGDLDTKEINLHRKTKMKEVEVRIVNKMVTMKNVGTKVDGGAAGSEVEAEVEQGVGVKLEVEVIVPLMKRMRRTKLNMKRVKQNMEKKKKKIAGTMMVVEVTEFVQEMVTEIDGVLVRKRMTETRM